ncbi:MAG: hypothetical protein H0W99_06160 [Acidobacteria bacterium]|nr:hypothetical protein [Acidobacteriota bacterium]
MNTRNSRRLAFGLLSTFTCALTLLFLLYGAVGATTTARVSAQNPTARTPSETVREFYKALSEKRFRDAFAISTLKGAIEGLSNEEFEDLRPDFERMAVAAGNVSISGEQVSGETATVFVRMKDANPSEPPDQVSLMRGGGIWVLGDKASQEAVNKEGKKYFFKARIDTHHSEVQDMLRRINVGQFVYNKQHNGRYGDMPALIAAGLIPKDLESTESTGYRFHITLSADAKSFTAEAEPARYGRTGRLSFFMDQTGIKSADMGGKPFSSADKR